ncbi:MAG: cyclodeaminase/cyclohydrolase family protein [bacterium]|nr:cyclodeaminase/cyclohydrolase family protein [bacterium]
MLINQKIHEYIAQTASASPAPGGGSASALAGALGASLSEMVINLTVGKKKYVDVSAELAELLPKLSTVRQELQGSIDRDTEAFNGVMAAFGLPKETEEQQKIRVQAIQNATLEATKVPLSVMAAALEALAMTVTVAQKGNKNSASDAGVAGLLLAAAIDGAALNVKINLPGLPDCHPFKEEAAVKLAQMTSRKEKLLQEVQDAVAKNI